MTLAPTTRAFSNQSTALLPKSAAGCKPSRFYLLLLFLSLSLSLTPSLVANATRQVFAAHPLEPRHLEPRCQQGQVRRRRRLHPPLSNTVRAVIVHARARVPRERAASVPLRALAVQHRSSAIVFTNNMHRSCLARHFPPLASVRLSFRAWTRATAASTTGTCTSTAS